MFFSWFRRKTSLMKLQQQVAKTQKKDWDRRLDLAVKAGKEMAEQGKTSLIINDKLLRCAHNANRPWDDILNDVQKRFEGCKVFFNSLHGHTAIEVRWND